MFVIQQSQKPRRCARNHAVAQSLTYFCHFLWAFIDPPERTKDHLKQPLVISIIFLFLSFHRKSNIKMHVMSSIVYVDWLRILCILIHVQCERNSVTASRLDEKKHGYWNECPVKLLHCYSKTSETCLKFVIFQFYKLMQLMNCDELWMTVRLFMTHWEKKTRLDCRIFGYSGTILYI